ncbi:MAG TPA: twin-arginine translocation signal domain-containing protein [Geothrix sp.]|uniref:twin-arginine translocation signal domain-containing protein n=1 Tax=Geothrix mesophila TaxID=2922723 RepID=UPI001FACEC67|nr:twin-arginine translocation signal domain-containing protein [Geothrix sp. SG198]HJV37549.1 twin-arginine translocation signal domain-containing protein [Geothrix sp.]
MTVSRREFLQWSAAASALAATGLDLSAAPADPAAKPAPKRILILGGTGFLGPATIEIAQSRGHHVTMFNRGKTRPDLFPGVEKLHGDRDPKKGEGLKALETGTWDAVIDNSAYYPRMVAASAGLLAPRVKQYLIISSISAYKEPNPENGTEDAPLATLADPAVEEMGKEYQNYGGLKALCEQAAHKALPGRTAVIRPGYIVGPDDPSGRFTYWPVRFDRGGELAVPGGASDPVQIIDVRDLAAWLVHLVEQGTVGTFNACGPDKRLAWGSLVDAFQKGGNANAKPVWIPTDFLAKQKDIEFPIWAPYAGETKGFHTWRNDRAVKAGLRFRPALETVKDTLAWYKTQEKVEKGRTRLAGPSAEAEAKLIAAWRAASKLKG